jgi:hypothetical protein
MKGRDPILGFRPFAARVNRWAHALNECLWIAANLIRTLKATGLALLAVLALGAASASAAEFHSSTAWGTIDTSQVGNNVFTTADGLRECEVRKFSGTYSAATTRSKIVIPTYNDAGPSRLRHGSRGSHRLHDDAQRGHLVQPQLRGDGAHRDDNDILWQRLHPHNRRQPKLRRQICRIHKHKIHAPVGC